MKQKFLPTEAAPDVRTFVDVLRRQATNHSEKTIYKYVSDAGDDASSLTYSELDANAQAVAARLQLEDVFGERALLLFPQGLEFISAFFGCLYAGVVAVPAYPPPPSRPERALPRLKSMIEDARPAVVLTTSKVRALAESMISTLPEARNVRWIEIDRPAESVSEPWLPPRLNSRGLAFLQYTSGSTGVPKGVMVTHGNLLHNQRALQRGFQTDSETVVAGWLPLFHDMGLIGNVLHPLFVGGSCVLMSPTAFIQRPSSWLRLVSRHRATISGGPNFAFELCARRKADEELADLDLSSWRTAFNGAEPVRQATLERFARAFEPFGFRRDAFFPCYGLAEATLFVSGNGFDTETGLIRVDSTEMEKNRILEADGGDSRTLVGSGSVARDTSVLIADPETGTKIEDDRVGEIWVSGGSVAQGYWNRPDETERTFGARLADTGEGPFLRTGDLGFIRDGRVFVSGRLKDLVIIRGRNHYPQDIEATVEAAHPALRPTCSAAFSVEIAGEERLVVAVEVEPRAARNLNDSTATEIVDAVRRAVADEHEVRVHAAALLEPGTLPKTSSGKVQRRLCRSRFVAGELRTIFASASDESFGEGFSESSTREGFESLPGNERVDFLEQFYRTQISRLLRVDPSGISTRAELGALGFDSLSAVELQHTIETEFGVSVPLTMFFGQATLTDLVAHTLENLPEQSAPAGLPAEIDAGNDAEQPLSSGQKALWFLRKLSPESAAENLAHALKINGPLDTSALRRALGNVVEAHPALRSTFAERNGEPFSVVRFDLEPAMIEEDASGWTESRIQARLTLEADKPFELENEPPLRVLVLRRSAGEFIVQTVLHHIVGDYRSAGILFQGLSDAYRAETQRDFAFVLPPETPFVEFVREQNRIVESPAGAREIEYWTRRLADAPASLDLPTDRPRPAVGTHRGASLAFSMSPELSEKARKLANSRGVTANALLLAAFTTVLHRLSGQADVSVGIPSIGRTGSRFSRTVGYFVNPLTIRSRFTGSDTFLDLVNQVGRTILEALDHANVPFPVLVERLQPERDPSRSPFFQVMFAWQHVSKDDDAALSAAAVGQAGIPARFGGLECETLAVETRSAQFDFTLAMAEVEGRLCGHIQYNTDLFDAATINRFRDRFESVLAAATENPETRVQDLPISSQSEIHLLLNEWSGREVDFDRERRLHEAFEHAANRFPDTPAVADDQTTLTYAELNRRADELAARLRQSDVGPGDIVGVCLPPSVDVPTALLAVLKTGAAYLPIDPAYPKDRIDFMLKDSEARMLVKEGSGFRVQGSGNADRDFEGFRKLNVSVIRTAFDSKTPNPEPRTLNPDFQPRTLNPAYVIYTSGSTGAPKGVVCTHLGIMNLLDDVQRRRPVEAGDGCGWWTSLGFDVSVYEIFSALCFGGTLHIPSPEIRLDPSRLFEWMNRRGVKHAYLPPFFLADFAESLARNPGSSSLKKLLVGVEPISERLLVEIRSRLDGATILNGYGPTETAVCSTLYEVPAETPVVRNTPIGRPVQNTRLFVLDEAFRPVPVGVAGELFIGGDGLALGYLNRKELTAVQFVSSPFFTAKDAKEVSTVRGSGWVSPENSSLIPHPSSLLYRTGDIVRFLADGNLEFIGRRDNQVKIRGHRIETGEIEAALLKNEAIGQALVMAREDVPGEKRLVAYVVPKESFTTKDTKEVSTVRGSGWVSPENSSLITRHLSRLLPAYMIPSAFVVLDAFPTTPNGKIDRKALPAPKFEASAEPTGDNRPDTPVRQQLAAIWSAVLGVETVGLRSNFFELGGHSLAATRVLSRIRDAFDIELPLSVLFEAQTLAALAERIEAKRGENAPADDAEPIRPAKRDQSLPLSFAQQRLWFLDQYEPENPFYNMPGAVRLVGTLNTEALNRSFDEIVRRHEALRTNFCSENGKPVQVVAGAGTFRLPMVDLSEYPEERRDDEFQRIATLEARTPFNLAVDSLFRTKLVKLNDAEHVLLVTMHHIVSDGWSVGVLVREFAALYEAFSQGRPSPLAPLGVQYADYSVWQRNRLEQPAVRKQLDYWKKQLADLPTLDVPTDRPRPAVQSFQGEVRKFVFDADLVAELKDLGRREGATLFMTLLAGFQALLHRLTGQDEIVVGSPVAGRNRSETEGLIGFFVNSLVMRTDVSGNPTFAEMLGRVRRTALDAQANQDVPFEMLVDELQPQRDASRNPLFQVMFQLENTPRTVLELPDLVVSRLETERGTTQFDVSIDTFESERGLELGVEYSTDLFDPETIDLTIRRFESVLRAVVADSGCRLSDLPLLTDEETRRITVEWNQTGSIASGETCVHRLFESRAAQQPTRVAVTQGTESLTYQELNRRANRLARYIQRFEAGPETTVGLCLENGIDAAVGMLAVLKAGAAYLPLDPNLPAKRLEAMLREAGTTLLVTNSKPVSSALAEGRTVVDLDTDRRSIAAEIGLNVESGVLPDNPAYVIFTSGSTGNPKGVAVTHAALASHNLGVIAEFGLTERDRVLQFASLSFDVAAEEILPTLISGATLVLPVSRFDVAATDFNAFIEREQISVVNLPAAFWHEWVRELARLNARPGASLRLVVAGSEKVLVERFLDWKKLETADIAFLNAYGTTETTVTSTLFEPSEGVEHRVAGPALPVGRPIAGTRAYVLDRELQPVPVGVRGELHIGGDNLARGYVNRPDLTAERFIPDPFSSEPGRRLYKTGDVARFMADGTLEILGRADRQVKVRGFRIETEEIEAVLGRHPAVKDAVVTARETTPGENRLIAHVVWDASNRVGAATELHELLEEEQLSQWQAVHDDEVFNEMDDSADPTFNISGWNSSFTGFPIPAREMREWADQTVDRILALRPSRVLEIGCGTGLLLFRVAPACSRYLGTDFSKSALRHIQTVINREALALPHVELSERRADDFTGIRPGGFDVVVVNSVAQYFPSAEYFTRVIEGAAKAVKPGGSIYLGDIRNLRLLDAFHASVLLHQSEDDTPVSDLAAPLAKRIEEEEELVLAPEYFETLPGRIPTIKHVEIHLRRGVFHNEMSCFRYDVVLRTGEGEAVADPSVELDWTRDGLELEILKRRLIEHPTESFSVRGIPNARLDKHLRTVEAIRNSSAGPTVGAVLSQLETLRADSVDPESVWSLGSDSSRAVRLAWTKDNPACFDAVFEQSKEFTAKDAKENPRASADHSPLTIHHSLFSNTPLFGKFARRLVPELRTYLSERLPEHMVPSAFVPIEKLPVTPNGKIDFRALPVPENAGAFRKGDFTAPRTPVESRVAEIWARVLGLDHVGIHDNFFEIGGHSLSATQVVSRVRDAFQRELPLRSLFEAQTVEEFAKLLEPTTEEAESSPSGAPGGIVPVPRAEFMPVSFAQQRLWFLDQLEPGTPFHNIAGAVRIRGQLDAPALERALSEIVGRHESLRTTFAQLDGTPVQVIGEAVGVTLDIETVADGEQAAVEAARRLALEPFSLSEGPLVRFRLFRLDESNHLLALSMHHIVSDGWSIGVLIAEAAALYRAFVEGQPSPLAPLPIQYADYAVRQREWLTGEAFGQRLDHWKRQLGGELNVLDLPTDRPRPAVQTHRGDEIRFSLPSDTVRRIHAQCRRADATPYAWLLAVLQIVLHRHSGQEDIRVGSPIAGRTLSETENLIGFFVNTLVMRTDLSGNPTFTELLGRVRQTVLDAQANQDVPFELIVEELNPERSLDRTPLFQVLFAFQNTPRADLELPGAVLSRVNLGSVGAKFDLAVSAEELTDRMEFVFEYNADLFDRTTMVRFHHHFRNLVQGALNDPGKPIGNLDMPAEAELNRILVEWNQTRVDYPTDVCLHELFEAQVARTPDAVAVSLAAQPGSSDRAAVLTYRELNERANRTANALGKMGVGPDVLVGVFVERSLEMVQAVYGILKAGGAYVPLDPDYPTDRVAFMIEDSKTRVLLTQTHLVERLPQLPEGVRVVCLDAGDSEVMGESAENLGRIAGPTDLAYMIYTSGSTGRPKGAMNEHRGIVNRLLWMQDTYRLTETDVVLQKTPFSFDVSVWELFWPLLAGAKLVMAAPEGHKDPDYLTSVIQNEGVTTIHFVPSMLAAFLEAEKVADCSSLKRVICSGEALPPRLVERHFKVLNAELHNLYGPTEAAVDVTAYQCRADSGLSTVPIGKPIANIQMYILDRHLKPVPVGVAGELFIGGVGVGRGYLNRPELTSERFIPNPFFTTKDTKVSTVRGSGRVSSDNSSLIPHPSSLLYRTGDSAQWMPDGNIEFLGRLDHQVKLRGFRIELGEIEAALVQIPGVKEALVVVREDRTGDKRLVAYVVSEPEAQFNAKSQSRKDAREVSTVRGSGWFSSENSSLITHHLSRLLPEYMVPSAFVVLDALPLSPNGKIDRKALPAPETGDGEREFIAPRTPIEERIASIWAEVLGVERVGIRDTFFDLGGHSLLAVQLLSRLRKAFPVEPSLKSIFEAPTVERLASVVEALLIERIESLTDEEAELLFAANKE